MENKRLSEIFGEIADMMEIEDGKRVFEAKAYRKASQVLDTMQEDVAEILRNSGTEGLMEIPGIGKTLADRIKEYLETGRIKKYEQMKKRYPIDLDTMTGIQGVGPKRAFRLYKDLGIRNIEDLKKAVGRHRIRELEGFGERSEAEMAKGILAFESSKGRMLLGDALPEAESIISSIRSSGLAKRAEIAGSTRRMKETVGDIDILIISAKPEAAMDFIERMKGVESTVLRGPTKMTVKLRMGLNCDFRIVEEGSFGAALQYFIGNKSHNVKTRQIAIRKGYKLNEYGLFDKKGSTVAGDDEREIYEKLGLDYMEPEMREDRGEIELAEKHKVFRLVQLEDIKGDLHMHTKYSDGMNSMEEMAAEAAKAGMEYIGFTDHSKAERIANGMDERKFKAYSAELDRVRKKYEGRMEILKSAETDILKDGSLDFGRKALESMDYVLAAVHSNLNMNREEMTSRIVKCLESGMVDIMAHPTDRLINQRPPIEADWERIFDTAKDNGVVMEVDSFPDRLDLNDENILRAREHKLMFAIDTDSHRTDHMKVLRYGVGTAKRGWLRKKDVINTMDFRSLVKHFDR